METKAAGASSARLYEEFEPYCKWLTDQILEIDLNGFKKKQLKVRANGGILTIFGERPLDAANYKWSRFRKEVRLSRDCNVNEIRAKFSHEGILSITLPKKAPPLKPEAGGEAAMEERSLWGVKIRKGTAIKVAVVVVIMAVAFALGTRIAWPVKKHPHDAAGENYML